MKRACLLLVALISLGCPPSSQPAPSGRISPRPVPSQAPTPDATTPDSVPQPSASPTDDEAMWGSGSLRTSEDEVEPPAEPLFASTARPPSEDDGAITRFPGLRIYMEERRVEVAGYVCLKEGPTLELLGCTRNGKTHESLLLFDCDPQHLNVALIMLGLEPTPQVDELGQPIALETGERVVMEVAWRAADAPAEDTTAPAAVDGQIRRRVEDLIFDRLRQDAMPPVGWVFTGSRHVEVPAPPDWETLHEVFAASYTGNVAATFHDPDCILDTPLLEGGDDTIYNAYSARLPERGTPVVIHLRPWTEADGPPLAELPPPGGALTEDTRDQAPSPDGGDATEADPVDGDGSEGQ